MLAETVQFPAWVGLVIIAVFLAALILGAMLCGGVSILAAMATRALRGLPAVLPRWLPVFFTSAVIGAVIAIALWPFGAIAPIVVGVVWGFIELTPKKKVPKQETNIDPDSGFRPT